MATVSKFIEYPTSDGKPMAETEDHRDLMFDLIYTLKGHRRTARRLYVTGNLLLYYEEGNKHKHVSPDVWATSGVSKRRRKYYLLWEEGKAPEVVIELTSSSTRREDVDKKFKLYRDVLKVKEYFLFDPHQEYLSPTLQGYRLVRGQYVRIEPIDGRLPSEVLEFQLEQDGGVLRFLDPVTGRRLLTPEEARRKEAAARKKEAAGRRHEAEARQREAEGRQREAEGRQRAEAEVERLRQELESLRRRLP